MRKWQSPPLPQTWRSHLLSSLDAYPDLPRLKQLLARAITSDLWRHDPFVSARIIASFASSSDLAFAQLAFDAAHRPSAFSYNAMIRAHSTGPTPFLSLHLFRQMLRSDLYPDRFTFPFLLRAAPSSSSALHALALIHGVSHDSHVATSLLHSYASSGIPDSAFRVFDEMPERSTVTWNAIISCCARSIWQEEGLCFLSEMLSSGAHANADTLIGALSCCTGLGALAHGRSVHALATRRCVGGSVELVTALIHMYAKCGSLESGRRVFETMEGKDASTWTAMIGGLAVHGRGEEAVSLFDKMVGEGLAPDSQAFTSVLHACSHSGLVEVGIRLFNDMKEKYRIEARKEHYGAMVDLFGRAGRVEEAEEVVKSMMLVPNPVVWGSLLHASMVNGEFGSGERLERRLLGLGLGLEEGGFYVGVSNVYAMVGRWDEVGRVRGRMVEKGVRKESGFSLVEMNGRVHKFLVGDTGHPLTREIYSCLCEINRQMVYI